MKNAILSAANEGNSSTLEKALAQCGDSACFYAQANDSQALWLAAIHNHPQCVALLIPYSEPKSRGSRALGDAVYHNHTECVRMLIPVSDPKAWDSQALQNASARGHQECFDLLWPVSDPEYALKAMKKSPRYAPKEWRMLEERLRAEQHHDQLVNATHITPYVSKPNKKM